jgi:hypothetical protein
VKRRLLVLLAVVAVVAALFAAAATRTSSGHALADPTDIVTNSGEGFLDGH